MPKRSPNCYVIGGSNGAGKTTFASEFLPLYADCPNFINPDFIARAFSPFNPDAGLMRAGRMVLARINEFESARTDFAFESTLSGRSYVPVLKRLRRSGFHVHLFYLWIPNADLGLLRIHDRVESGGHDVPERDVRRRFDRTFRNLFTLYRPLADTLHFFDNASEAPRLVFKDEAGKTSVLDALLYNSLLRTHQP